MENYWFFIILLPYFLGCLTGGGNGWDKTLGILVGIIIAMTAYGYWFNIWLTVIGGILTVILWLILPWLDTIKFLRNIG